MQTLRCLAQILHLRTLGFSHNLLQKEKKKYLQHKYLIHFLFNKCAVIKLVKNTCVINSKIIVDQHLKHFGRKIQQIF